MDNRVCGDHVSFQTSEDDLRALFAAHGDVTDVPIVMERDTGRSRGFAFVERALAEPSHAAIAMLDGYKAGDRKARVSEAKTRGERGSRHGALCRCSHQRGATPAPVSETRRDVRARPLSASNPLTFVPSKETLPWPSPTRDSAA